MDEEEGKVSLNIDIVMIKNILFGFLFLFFENSADQIIKRDRLSQ